MTKQELVSKMADDAGISKKAAEEALNSFVSAVKGALKKGNRIWIDNLLMGVGLRQPIGEKASIYLLVLWDVTQNEYSPHVNPVIRVGFSF